LSNYYTKLELQTSGQSSVHFDNITDAFHNNLLDLQGGLSTSSGDSSGNDAEYYHLDLTTYLDIVNISFVDSIVKDSVNAVSLVNDLSSPGNSMYYGTDVAGTKGWYDLPASGGDSLWEDLSNGFIAPVDSSTVGLYILGDIQTEVDDTNTKLGVGALASLTSGTTNVAIGKNALNGVTSGYGNIGIGESALAATTESEGNIGIGFHAVDTNISGTYNIGLGVYALSFADTGDYNIGIGYGALYQNRDGDHNIAIGFEAGCFCLGSYGVNENGQYHIFIGDSCLASGNDTVSEIVIGHDAIGQGSGCTVLGGMSTIATYLVGEIYAVTYDSSGNTTGALPEATTETNVVYYDPITGKLSYAYLGDIGSGGSTGSGVDVYGTPKEHDIVVWHDGDTITNLDGFYILDSGSGYIEIDAPIYAMFVGNETIHDFYLQGYYGQSDDHDGGYISLMGGDGYKDSGYEGDGGGIELRGGDCYGDRDAGTVDIYGGRARGSGGYAGWVEITGGLGGPNNTPGSVAIIGGLSETNTNPGGDVLIYGGAGSIRGDIYFGNKISSGCLPEADSDQTYCVYYDPTDGKLSYGEVGAGPGGTEYTFIDSLQEDSSGNVSLDNDQASPGNYKFYGTDASGNKGWYDLQTVIELFI
ncbi:MAG: hypothetical protein GYA51_11980, partial [Candidatus Methanofastidiosa archaeon]|nr:hypothetical protein [Candidatus Methanofastidiosa archaeon]